MGLPGAGKTTLAETLFQRMENCAWLNADKVRTLANDWDFSPEARLRQAKRMATYAAFEQEHGRHVISDFVAPTDDARCLFSPDFIIWMNTIEKGRFEDTNKLFEAPLNADLVITDWGYDVDDIKRSIFSV